MGAQHHEFLIPRDVPTRVELFHNSRSSTALLYCPSCNGRPDVILTVTSRLETTPAHAWSLIKQPATFLFVARGVLRLSRKTALPDEWAAGQIISSRMIAFGFIPGWTHRIEILSIDDANRVMQTAETGGPLRRWEHTLAVVPNEAGCSVYTDTVNLDAGLLTPLAWIVAWVFFHYRQSRLRRLARIKV